MNVSASHPPPQPPPPAPWRSLFESHLRANSTSGQEFALATIRNEDGRPVPRVRTCGFRGFWPDPADLHSKAVEQLEEDAKNATSSTTGTGGGGRGRGLNPRIYESDMLTFTTDIRMEKVHEINEAGHVVEAVFWLKDVGNQWRIRGEAFAIGAGAGAGGQGTAGHVGGGEGFARDEIRKGMRRVQGGPEEERESGSGKKGEAKEEEEWTWERAVTTYFANHTPIMRGSFKSPPPGRPRSEQPSDPALKPGQKLKDLHDPVARKNFRVVVIRPTEVERLDLTDYEKPQRWSWTLVDGGSQWKEVELWP